MAKIHPDVEAAIEQIDAAIFSGDTFLVRENWKVMNEMLSRWQREMETHKKTVEDIELEARGIFISDTRVHTLDALHDDQYTENAKVARKWGVCGKVIKHRDSHGLCYDVKHDDGTIGSYDPDEIDIIEMLDIGKVLSKGFKYYKGASHQLWCNCCGEIITAADPFWSTDEYHVLETCGKKILGE